MGVKSCYRTGCTGIMCERYCKRYGYICYECIEELKKKDQDIEAFMNSNKQEFDDDSEREAWEIYLDTLFSIE